VKERGDIRSILGRIKLKEDGVKRNELAKDL